MTLKQRLIFQRRVEDQNATYPGYADAWAALRARVLQHGGEEVVPPMRPSPLTELLRAHGRAVSESTTCVLAPGEPSNCHRNAATLWRRGGAVAIGTGYALSADGLWREHSWAWGDDGRLIETTEMRTRYFGIGFDEVFAELFADWVTS